MALIETSGKITFLRVHDVGTGWGPANDHIDVEVIVKLDSHPQNAFGFQLRNDGTAQHAPACSTSSATPSTTTGP